jgi:hypothetical protein
MFKKILAALVLIASGFLLFVSSQPSHFHIARETLINAPADVIFTQVNDFHKWDAWSPWAKLDPDAKNSFEGAAAGKGAAFSWSGNNEVGEGRMTIADSEPNSLIRIQLDFLKPFKATNNAEFTFKPEGNQTLVSWVMSGENNFIGKIIGVFMNCDKMVGGQFEKGLASLKAVAEAAVVK